MTGTGFPASLRVSHKNRRINTQHRRNGKLQSCEPCRKAKVRCDHMMPTCGRCARRNKPDQCVYHPAPLTKNAAIPTTPITPESGSPETGAEPMDLDLSVSRRESSDLNSISQSPHLEHRDSLTSAPRSRTPQFSQFRNTSDITNNTAFARSTRSSGPRLPTIPLPSPSSTTNISEKECPHPTTDQFLEHAGLTSHSAILFENSASIGIDLSSSAHMDPLRTNNHHRSTQNGGNSNTNRTGLSESASGRLHISRQQIERGARVLTLLKDLPLLDRYIEKWFWFTQGIVVLEPMVRGWSDGIWEAHRKILEKLHYEDHNNHAALLALSEKVWQNTLTPLDITSETTPYEYIDMTTGENLRWEVVGIILTIVALLGFNLQDGDPIFVDVEEGTVVDRRGLVERMVGGEEECVRFCEEVEVLGDLYLWLLYESTAAACSRRGRGSYTNYQKATYLYNALLAHRLHVPSPRTPFFLSQLRARLLCSAYANDKFSAAFNGRPPRLTRHYVSLSIPLDLSDSQLMSSGDPAVVRRFLQGSSIVDSDGWNKAGEVGRCTYSRICAGTALITEEILELSLGCGWEEGADDALMIQRAKAIETKAEKLWSSFPAFLKLERLDEESWSRLLTIHSPIKLFFLADIRLFDLCHHFLLQRTIVKKAKDPGEVRMAARKLLKISRKAFEFVGSIVKRREAMKDFQSDFVMVLVMYGIPAAAVVAIELWKREKRGFGFGHGQRDVAATSGDWEEEEEEPLPRSATIQDLAVFVSCLSSIRPDDGGYRACDRGRRFLKAILDGILDPPPVPREGRTRGGRSAESSTSFAQLEVERGQQEGRGNGGMVDERNGTATGYNSMNNLEASGNSSAQSIGAAMAAPEVPNPIIMNGGATLGMDLETSGFGAGMGMGTPGVSVDEDVEFMRWLEMSSLEWEDAATGGWVYFR